MKNVIIIVVVIVIAAAGYSVLNSKSTNTQPDATSTLGQNSSTLPDKESLLASNKINNSNQKLKKGYFSEEYYSYDMSEKCQVFIRNRIRTLLEFDKYMEKVFPNDGVVLNDDDFINEMKQNFNQCSEFLRKKTGEISEAKRQLLLDKAVQKKDPSAMAKKAFEELFIKKRKVSDVRNLLIESLSRNNPEALYTMSVLTQQTLKKDNSFLIGAALLYRACDVGYKNCGEDSHYVQQTCQEQSICGGNIQETLRMAVPAELANDFENTIVEIQNILTEQDWIRFFDTNFPLED